jgi:chemotaxis protein histidine kinase CheA
MSLKEQGFDDGAYATLYRFAHTLKGSGAMLGLSAIADLAVEIHAVLLLQGLRGKWNLVSSNSSTTGCNK